MIIASNNNEFLEDNILLLTTKIELKDLSEPKHVLGIRVIRHNTTSAIDR